MVCRDRKGEKLISAIGFGLVEAAIVAIAAIGFTIQFAMTNVLNLAFGAVMGIAMFTGYDVEQALGGSLGQWFSVVVGGATGAVASLILYTCVLKPFLRRGAKLLTMVVITVSASTVITYALQLVVGPQQETYGVINGRLNQYAGFDLTTTQLIMVALAGVITVVMTVLLRMTMFGKALRATASNPTVAGASGVPVRRIADFAWLLSGALCGIGGIVLAISVVSFSYTTGTVFITEVFAAAILGGVGNPIGAVVGAVIIGVVSEVAAAYTSPAYKDVFAFGMLILVLLVRPNGLIGTSQQREALSQ
jgi:branched-chain amino acid transport system permease protein/neutral amino acid transport system permease protein